MKKLLVIMAAFMLVFGGCSNTSDNGSVSQNNTQSKKDVDDIVEDIFEGDKADIDDDILDDLGETVNEIKALHGEVTLSEWVNGPVYRFSDNDFWYAFSEYEITDNGYVPKGVCNLMILPLYELITTPDGNIDTDTLVEVSDTKVSRGYDDMDGMYYYEITHDDYAITVYTDQNGDISGDSSARVIEIDD